MDRWSVLCTGEWAFWVRDAAGRPAAGASATYLVGWKFSFRRARIRKEKGWLPRRRPPCCGTVPGHGGCVDAANAASAHIAMALSFIPGKDIERLPKEPNQEDLCYRDKYTQKKTHGKRGMTPYQYRDYRSPSIYVSAGALWPKNLRSGLGFPIMTRNTPYLVAKESGICEEMFEDHDE